MSKCRISVSFDGENFFWIVVENEKFIRSPTKEDLMGTKLKSYNKTNICPRCREERETKGRELTDNSILYPGNILRETGKNGKKTKEWVCRKHGWNNGQMYNINSRRNIIKSLRDCRTGNLTDHTKILGDNSQELACELYGWIDLNIENDNYHSPLDCFDPKAGLYHQVQGRYYNSISGQWGFSSFEKEWWKKFEDMVCLCISKDGNKVERIYKFPLIEIKKVKGIAICKNLAYKGCGWYEKYRVIDGDELKKANEIWIQILKKKKTMM